MTKKRVQTERQPDPDRTDIPLIVRVPKNFTVEWSSVPEWANYVAIDADGDIWAFLDEPRLDRVRWQPDGDSYKRRVDRGENPADWGKPIGRLGFAIDNWPETLVERPGVSDA